MNSAEASGGLRSAGNLAVACRTDAFILPGKVLAERLSLPMLGVADPRRLDEPGLLLLLDEGGLCLQATGRKAAGPVRAEFVSGKAGYRREHGGGSGQLIAKAVGLQKARVPLTVLDATAGLGQDAFVLAGLGCRVILHERCAAVHALLEDGLARALSHPQTAPIVSRMLLQPEDSMQALAGQPENPVDVIYLDPMFPHRDKSALVKKEMRLFRDLVGNDEDAPELLRRALEHARYRVVVKRPRKAEALAGPLPATRVEGKSSRYDIYPLQAFDKG